MLLNPTDKLANEMIQLYTLKYNTYFTDIDFPPTDLSIYGDDYLPQINSKTNTQIKNCT